MQSELKWAPHRMEPGLPPHCDSGLINGLAGAGPHPVAIMAPDRAWFDSEDEAKEWAAANGHDPELVLPVEVHTLVPMANGGTMTWTSTAIPNSPRRVNYAIRDEA